MNVLLVDDKMEGLLAMEAVLEPLGQRLVRARSGREALRHVLSRDFAVILLDVQMPEMDGFETAALIRQRETSRLTPIIFVTAFNRNDQEVLRKGYTTGAVDFLFKPVVPEILRSKVAVFVELAEARETRIRAEVLERERDAAQEANRAKTWFLANVSHELRTPLNSIIGFANILARAREERLAAEAAEYVERIRKNGQHLLGIINNILDVTKIESGRMELAIEPVRVDDLVREVASQLAVQAQARGLNLVADVPRTLEPLMTDAGKLRQVVTNLAGNAIKFTERGLITLRIVADPDTGIPAAIEVADTGIGIPAQKLGAIFEAFTQVETGHARRFEGTGLGLTITRSLLDVMGYALDVESEPGRGSVFRVRLSAHCGACDLADGRPRRPLDPSAN